jgi:hydroxypyruvate isomerase
MIELSACIEWLFAEEPAFATRVRRAAEEGLPCVEFWTWRDKDIAELSAALRATGVRLTSFLSEPEARLVDRTTHPAFLAGVEESARVAASLDCRHLIVLAGDRLAGAGDREQREAVVAGLRRAAPRAAEHDVTLLLEPLNTRVDHPGAFLDATRDGLDIVQAVAADNVRLLLDIYHAVVMGEAPQDAVGDRMDLVGHVHAADVPGRHEPGTGTIDWTAIAAWLSTSGYDGAVGLEYMPSGSRTGDSIALIKSELG